MRVASLLFVLPALAAAQEQKPLGGWFNKIKAVVSEAVPAAVVSPVAAAAAKVEEKTVTRLRWNNWESVLAPKPEAPEDWMVYVTGGNKTCFGRCGQADAAWNKSVAVMSLDPKSPSLAKINCEHDTFLCSVWGTGAPSVWYIKVPAALETQPKAATDVHIIKLNTTTVTTDDIVKLYSAEKYKEEPAYEGIFQPFDGALAPFKLNLLAGGFVYIFTVVPSWLFMIGISFLSRTFMGRRTMPQPRPAGAAAAN